MSVIKPNEKYTAGVKISVNEWFKMNGYRPPLTGLMLIVYDAKANTVKAESSRLEY